MPGARPAHRAGGVGLRDEAPLRDARGWELGPGLGRPEPTHRHRRPDDGQRRAHQRGPVLRRPRPPGVLRPRGDHAARALVTWTGPVTWSCARRRPAQPRPGPADGGALQEQHRRQGRLLRHPRELPHAPGDPFADIVRHLTPFFVARQVICGAGRVGIGQDSRTRLPDLQRADFFEAEVGLETTSSGRSSTPATSRTRPPTAIAGCTSSSATPTSAMSPTCSRSARPPGPRPHRGGRCPGAHLRQPVGTLQAVSHDPTLQALVALRDGRKLTALELLWATTTRARHTWLEDRGERGDPETAEVMTRWADVLTRLAADPMSCARELDWVAKLRCCRPIGTETAWRGPSRGWRPSDIQWSDLRPDKSVFALRGPGHGHRAARDRRRGAAAVTTPRRTPGPGSGASACAACRGVSSPPRGTRSSSRFPASSRCNASRCWSRSRHQGPGRGRARAQPRRRRRCCVNLSLSATRLDKGSGSCPRPFEQVEDSMASQEQSRPQRREGDPELPPDSRSGQRPRTAGVRRRHRQRPRRDRRGARESMLRSSSAASSRRAASDRPPRGRRPAGRLPTAYLRPGSASFTEFLAGVAPELLPGRRAAARRR
jgi:hypothetical protein